MTQLILALLILAADTPVQTEADQVFACDFEGSTDQNFDGWPDDWTRRRGRGYPSYIPIEILADETSASPNRCLRIKLDGGAARIYSPPIPIVPQFNYELTGRIRTRGLEHNIVSTTISFYDGEDKLLETHESPELTDADDWTETRIGPVTPAGEKVRTAVVSIHVRPTERSDLTGEIWVDDLWLGRLPKLTLEISGENGFFTEPKAAHIICRVSGFKNARPPIKFELLDVHGTVVQSEEVTMEAEADSGRLRVARTQLSNHRGGFSGSTSWHPKVPASGFYTVRVSTPAHSGQAMKEELNFVVLPPLPRRDSGEFGWSLSEGDHPLPIRVLPTLLSQTGVHWIKFPVWFSNTEMKRADEIAWFAERLSSYDIQMVGLLDQPPAEIREFLGTKQRMPIASAFSDKAVWHPALDPVMTRLSLKVRWWQLGRDDDTSFATYPQLGAKLNEIRTDLASFGQTVNVGVPWKVLEERTQEDELPWAFFSLVEDVPLTAEELKSYIDAKSKDKSKRWIILQPLSKSDYDLQTRARDLVQRMLAGKIAGADAVFVPHPFNSEFGLMQANGTPGPLLLPWRTTAMLVAGGEYAGSMKLPEGSENYVFMHDHDAVVVAWNHRRVTEKLYLGPEVRQYDVWGRQSTPRSQTVAGSTVQEIEIGPMPIFLTGVNSDIARWRMGFRFDTDGLASVFGREQTVSYQFTNTFPHAIGGRVKFHLPTDWKVASVERQFKIGPGELLRDVLRIQLGADATTGLQPIQVDFDINGDGNHKFRLYETLRVGLGDLQVQLETRLDDLGNLIVDQHLTNNTDKNVSFKCFLTVPGRRRERQQVFNLGRGRTTNTYTFPDGKELIDKVIWLRAEEIGGARVLNDHIIVHE